MMGLSHIDWLQGYTLYVYAKKGTNICDVYLDTKVHRFISPQMHMGIIISVW